MEQKTSPEQLQAVLVTDCGSTTTKAVLFEKKPEGWRQTFRGEAPTTVEKPVADVTIGAINAFCEVAEVSGRNIVAANSSNEAHPFEIQTNPGQGIDLYLSTSSAGGGLQMVVAGVVSSMTSASAERAALGAGAIVMDTISIDDGREPYERVQKIRHLRPDIILLAGGTDGGTKTHPLELCETVLQADPRPRFGETLTLPVIYAANKEVREQAKDILSRRFSFTAVDNIRPSLEEENLGPARDEIHELFLNHVMSHAPGYSKLLKWSPIGVMPTPAAVGNMVLSASKQDDLQIVAVDIGGATTDVFSVFRHPENHELVFNRTVSANLGMSYSIANVLLEAGEEAIKRWLPFELSADEVRDRLRNKMIRPTSIPQTLDDLLLEQAVCREALRLAFEHHKRLAVGLKGGAQKKSIANMFRGNNNDSLVDMLTLDLIIGSGGVLSHAPDRKSSALMLLDAYEPTGITRLAVDSIFMMPHLGVLAEVHPKAASEIFLRDCIVPLGTAIAPAGQIVSSKPALKLQRANGSSVIFRGGELRCLDLAPGETEEVELIPLSKNLDFGSGRGVSHRGVVHGGHAGLIIDLRGRPISFPGRATVREWYDAMSLRR